MSRRNRSPQQPVRSAAPSGAWPPPPPRGDRVEVVGDDGWDLPTAYDARPPRPVLQRAVRAGLWGAVALGCVGGLFGLFGGGTTTVQPVVQRSAADDAVPAPVAGVAEQAVEAWLSATMETDASVLDELFVEPPEVRTAEGTDLAVLAVRTVAGTRQIEGYWTVTVAARVLETPDTVDAALAEEEGTAEEPVPVTWYVQVGVVGDPSTRLAALTTPSVLPALPPLEEGWRSAADTGSAPVDGDPVSSTVRGFLEALLADGGDPSRYLAPGEEIAAADPAPFTQLVITNLSVDDLGDGRTRALARVEGTTDAGHPLVASYEVILVERTDRLEVTGFSGAPTLVVTPPDEPPETTETTEPPEPTDTTEGP